MPLAGKGSPSTPRGFSQMNMERPEKLSVLGTERASTVIRSARAAWVIQVLLPVIFHVSPSFTARVRRLPRSEPVLGSVNTAVGRISPEAMPGRYCSCCALVPPLSSSSAAISERVPNEPTPI